MKTSKGAPDFNINENKSMIKHKKCNLKDYLRIVLNNLIMKSSNQCKYSYTEQKTNYKRD